MTDEESVERARIQNLAWVAADECSHASYNKAHTEPAACTTCIAALVATREREARRQGMETAAKFAEEGAKTLATAHTRLTAEVAKRDAALTIIQRHVGDLETRERALERILRNEIGEKRADSLIAALTPPPPRPGDPAGRYGA